MERRRKRETNIIRLTLYSRMLQLIGFQNSQMDSNHRFKKLQISIRINTKKTRGKGYLPSSQRKNIYIMLSLKKQRIKIQN